MISLRNTLTCVSSSLLVFILVNNLIGVILYGFASTSYFVLTFSISFSIVLGATILGFQKHGLEFFSLFVPSGCPLALLPLLVSMEFISYLARNISLGLRLAANVVAGHLVLHILSPLTHSNMTAGIIFFIGLFISYILIYIYNIYKNAIAPYVRLFT